MSSRRFEINTKKCGSHSTPSKSMYLDAQGVRCQANVRAARDRDVGSCAVKHHFPSPIISWIEDLSSFGDVSFSTDPEYVEEQARSSVGQSSTSSYLHDMQICQAVNEEEIHAVLSEQSLYPAGWIHTHPSQTCFLSSIDLHTQYSYQAMLPEAVAIVVAPTDPTRSYGIFRLTDPGGMDVIRECDESAFHTHRETTDGSPIYETCSKVHFKPNLRFEIVDLRSVP
ncbi:AMSH-like ubiquitin thioesterase 2 isoform X3 [Phragmites australis]|uniref:AMSH-like ubiquitin thioesterase 2 isoform X3 n=1 Tax=Phragmites australis TaxID=29695 RepID=UPI002D77AFE3|nr:AMSH-like ubiquitin thioesterase 2 isoform X3 [Phragmites australis]